MEIKQEFINFLENVVKLERNLLSKEASRHYANPAELETSLSCMETHIKLIRLAMEKLETIKKSEER
jgi:hypothetical protein